MANFAEGTIKLRGRAENIKSALKYMFGAVGEITIEEDTDGEIITFTTTDSYFFLSMAQNVLLLTMIVLKFILMMIFLSSNLIILSRRGELSQTITQKYLRNSMLTLRYSRLNKVCNLHKKLKSQKVKF